MTTTIPFKQYKLLSSMIIELHATCLAREIEQSMAEWWGSKILEAYCNGGRFVTSDRDEFDHEIHQRQYVVIDNRLFKMYWDWEGMMPAFADGVNYTKTDSEKQSEIPVFEIGDDFVFDGKWYRIHRHMTEVDELTIGLVTYDYDGELQATEVNQ